MRTRHVLCIFAVVVICGLLASRTWADPLPGEVLKFQQLPLNLGLAPSLGGAPFPGHDELSSAYPIFGPSGLQTGWAGRFMADDFADKFDTPVVHLRWWGSYADNYTGGTTDFTAKQFLISFESDVPATPAGGFSRPGEPLLNQIVRKGPLAPSSGTFTEKPIFSDGAPEQLYEYNAELHLGKEFPEHANKVYWLKVVALLDTNNVRWGWHNRDYTIPDPLASTSPAVVPGEFLAGTVPAAGVVLPVFHFQDDAVTGLVSIFIDPADPLSPRIDQSEFAPTHYVAPLDGPDLIAQFSKDLAFELYTKQIPEPATLGLLSLAIVTFTLRRRNFS